MTLEGKREYIKEHAEHRKSRATRLLDEKYSVGKSLLQT